MSNPPVYYLLLVGCLLLALGLAHAAWRRPDTRRRGGRVLAGLVAALGVWLTAYPPHRMVAVPQAEAILLTDGYQPDTLTALLKRFGPLTRVWRYAPDATEDRPMDTLKIASLSTLREQMPTLRRLHVVGRGLPAAALPALGPMRLVGHAPPPFTGFRSAHWNRKLVLGQPLKLTGYFAATGREPSPIWVRLHAAGAPRDSVQLPNGQGAFRLRYVPKTAGRLVATLSAGPSRQLLAREPVPAEVVPFRPLRVLLLAATPSFELKFLKNQLAARQHAVAWRAGISQGLTQTEFNNQPATDLSRLTPALLNRYDVLVAESGVLAALPAAEVQALRTAQRATGLGVIVLAESVVLPTAVPGRSGVQLVAQSGTAFTRPQHLAWPDAPAATALVPTTLVLSGSARPVVALAGAGQVVVARQRVGLGYVVVSALPETYPWLLQNASATYESYWSRLLTAAARPVAAPAVWTLADPWPRPQQPLDFRLAAPFPARPPVVAGTASALPARLPLHQDPWLPEWSTATYWPSAPGWNQVQLSGQPSHWFYVFADHTWQGPELQRRAQSALPWLTSASAPNELATLLRPEPWPAIWFFALFVVAAGFLWLEEKL